MARKKDLRKQRTGTVINTTSKKQESDIIKALEQVIENLQARFKSEITLVHESKWYLKDIVEELTDTYSNTEFHYHSDNTYITPDGGILYIKGPEDDNMTYPILISEVKNQGTNDLRAKEGLPRQPRGNAIERLGKNLIGLRTALMRETIFPFVCFGYGCDFESDSSILDRVSTMAMFGHLNKTYIHNDASRKFNRGSFYFRREPWSVEEMTNIMTDIAERSVLYYFSKYHENHFRRTSR